jgi:Tfp pilus assembly protein PilN
VKKGQEARRRTVLVAIAGIAVIAVVIVFWVIQGMHLSTVQDDIASQQQTNAALQSEIAGLQKYEDLQVEAQAQQAQLDAAFANEVSFSGMLVDVSKVIPPDTYLTSFDATLTTTAPGETITPTTESFIGTLTFAGETQHFDSLSTWLTRLEGVDGWANPWASTVTADTAVAGAYTFSTSVDLTQDALTERGKAGQVAAGG